MRRKKSKTLAKRHALNMRTTTAVRRQLEKAARLAGRSLTQEVDFRIGQSLAHDDQFGDPLTKQLAAMFAAVIMDAERQSGKSWLSDQQTYNRALLSIYALVGRLGQDKTAAHEFLSKNRRESGLDASRALLRFAGFADGAIAAALSSLK